MAYPLGIDPHGNQARDLDRAAQALREFYLRSHRVIDRMMTEQGASFARARVLMRIASAGSVRSIDLATTFGYAPRTVTETIDGLERDGLVRRDPDPTDRRAKRISVTPAGLVAVDSSEASRRQFVDTVYGALTGDECDELVRIVGKLVVGLAALEA